MRAVKTYEQFINESLIGKASKWWKDGKRLKTAARQWVRTGDKEERERIKADLEADGVDMNRWNDYLGDAYDEKPVA